MKTLIIIFSFLSSALLFSQEKQDMKGNKDILYSESNYVFRETTYSYLKAEGMDENNSNQETFNEKLKLLLKYPVKIQYKITSNLTLKGLTRIALNIIK